MKKISVKKLVGVILSVVVTTVIIWIFWANTALELNTYKVYNPSLPKSFNGFKIAQISDLHNAEIGKDNHKLLETLKTAKPDIIVITGDLVDSRTTNIEIALSFIKNAIEIAPCYFITGNHEARITEYEKMKNSLTDLGVLVLEDEKIKIKTEGSFITLIGVNDPSFTTDYLFGDSAEVMRNKLESLTEENDGYTILLSHRPELFDVYVDYDIDLTLSGHAHGGQFRLPFVGGVFAPNQGFFPQYDGGSYSKNNSTMIVSRGIGNSLFPLRFNNRPEVVLIELIKEK